MPRKVFTNKEQCRYCGELLDDHNKIIYEWRLKKGASLQEATGRYCKKCQKHRSENRGKLSKPNICPYCKKSFQRKDAWNPECSRKCTFLNNITIDKNECWNWSKNIQFYYNGRYISFQKVSLEIANHIKIKQEEQIYENCKNDKCCNPQHIELISKSDLFHKQVMDGKRIVKLTPQDIDDIKEKVQYGYSIKQLAQEYKVWDDSIYNALHGRTWKNFQTEQEKIIIFKKENTNCSNCHKEHDNTESKFCSPSCMQEFLLKQ